jgi:hypothetical protein
MSAVQVNSAGPKATPQEHIKNTNTESEASNLTYPSQVETRIRLNAEFTSFDEFIQEFDSYKQATLQVYSIASSTKKGDKTGYVTVLFKCKYSRNHTVSKGKGKRVHQLDHAIGCDAHIRVTNTRKNLKYTDKFRITQCDTGHNHVLDFNSFRLDTQNRILDKEDQIYASNLLSLGITVPRACEHMSRRTNKCVLPVDLNNIKSRYK